MFSIIGRQVLIAGWLIQKCVCRIDHQSPMGALTTPLLNREPQNSRSRQQPVDMFPRNIIHNSIMKQ